MSTPSQTQDPLLGKILASGTEPGDDASERILAAALSQAEDFGVRRFTIDDVARRVGVSRVTIYRYFPKKDRLIEAVMLHELRRFLRDIDAAIAPYDTLQDRLVEGFVFALTFLRKHRLLNRLLRTEPEFILPNLTVKAVPILAAAREFIAGHAHREAEQGGLPLTSDEIEGLSELLARAVLSFVLTPDSVLGLKTHAEIRRFAEHYLAPTLHALSQLPQTAS
ncbi:MAG: TetR/AcrR family transcriptional regulator [Solirubrobacteraceae bacterium]